jgi:hypothetical protein
VWTTSHCQDQDTPRLTVQHMTLLRNPNDGSQTAGYPGLFYLGSGPPVVTNSTIG